MMTEKNLELTAPALLRACAQLERLAAQDGKAPAVFAVVDAAGILRCLQRMDGAPLRSVAIATGKAYTAARMLVPTATFQARLAKDSLTLADFCDSGLTALPGGIPLWDANRRLLGAVGISGRTLVEDNELAEQFASLIEQEAKT